ncbi:hypothetical protein LNP74_15665 [Klebsiella pneumoniae subsp. pneumoniae]|nr:hypothetical protein [Klebsiella pneumoniae subsp. pneumoniae]
MIAFMGGGPPRRQPVGEVGGAKPRQRSALSGEPAFEPQRMMVECPTTSRALPVSSPG